MACSTVAALDRERSTSTNRVAPGRHLYLPGVEQVLGDLDRPETIPPALDGVQHSDTLQNNFVEAATRATVVTNVVAEAGRKAPYTIDDFARDYAPVFLGHAVAGG
jgi:uncharacterized protein YbjT (DUF2867 family)